MDHRAWRFLFLPEALVLGIALLASIRQGSSLSLLIFLPAILVFHAFGLRAALGLAARRGIPRGRAILLTLLLGMAWWGPLL